MPDSISIITNRNNNKSLKITKMPRKCLLANTDHLTTTITMMDSLTMLQPWSLEMMKVLTLPSRSGHSQVLSDPLNWVTSVTCLICPPKKCKPRVIFSRNNRLLQVLIKALKSTQELTIKMTKSLIFLRTRLSYTKRQTLVSQTSQSPLPFKRMLNRQNSRIGVYQMRHPS